MRPGRWALCLWPGLPQLWQGAWGGLLAAIGFGLLVNLILLGGLVWNQWIPSSQIVLGTLLLGLAWSASAYRNILKIVSSKGLASETLEDLFPLATGEYLRGNWFEVGRLCQQLLKRNLRDMEARLLWASTCRHAERHAEAAGRLEEMELLSGSEKWKHEIEGEWKSLERAAEEARKPANGSPEEDASAAGDDEQIRSAA